MCLLHRWIKLPDVLGEWWDGQEYPWFERWRCARCHKIKIKPEGGRSRIVVPDPNGLIQERPPT